MSHSQKTKEGPEKMAILNYVLLFFEYDQIKAVILKFIYETTLNLTAALS